MTFFRRILKKKLKLKANTKPIFRPKQPVPYATLDMVKKELQHLQQEDVIELTNYSLWAAPIVTKANGKV